MAITRDQSRPLTIPELAERMGLSRVAVYRKVKSGKIPATRVGRIHIVSARTARDILQDKITPARAAWIEAAVKKVVVEYGDVLARLSKE